MARTTSASSKMIGIGGFVVPLGGAWRIVAEGDRYLENGRRSLAARTSRPVRCQKADPAAGPKAGYQLAIKTWHSRSPRGGPGDTTFLVFSEAYG